MTFKDVLRSNVSKKMWVSFCIISLVAFVSPAFAQNTEQEEANKRSVNEFTSAIFIENDLEKAVSFLGDSYIQHNSSMADGEAGIKALIDILSSGPGAPPGTDVKATYADGNYVISHTHAGFAGGQPGIAIVDIYRLDDKGKIVEHWDVVQNVPETSVNSNSMF